MLSITAAVLDPAIPAVIPAAATVAAIPASTPAAQIEYTVLNIEPITSKDRNVFSGQGKISSKHVLADCWVVKSSELGMTDDDGVHCRTHLGGILNIGDTVLGLDIQNTNVNNPDMELMPADKIPDVVLVKKIYGSKALRNRRRRWNLKHMEGFPHMDTESANNDIQDFMNDMEEDKDIRQHINIYKSKLPALPVDEDEDDGGAPQISLAEMLDDLDLGMADAEDAMDGEGATMGE